MARRWCRAAVAAHFHATRVVVVHGWWGGGYVAWGWALGGILCWEV